MKKENNLPTLLFIMHMPPPVHGAAMVGQYIYDSKLFQENFDCHYINLATAKNLDDIGKKSLSKLWHFICLLTTICKTVKRIKPSLVYVTPNAKGAAFYKDFIVVALLKAMGCNIVVHYHNKGVVERKGHLLDKLLYKRFFRGLKVILLAKELYDDISDFASPEQVYICANGIPDTVTHPIDRPSNTSFKFLFLSNMMKDKGVYTLLEACKLLKARGISFFCTFVGGWKDVTCAAFEHEVEKKRLTKYVLATGPMYGNDKDKYWYEADAFIFPTYNECFPLVLLEAMQHGLPCISTNVGGILSIVDEDNTSFIVHVGNADELADKMQWMTEHRHEAAEMGKRGFEKYKAQYTLEIFETRLMKIFEEILNQ
uniref:Glycosyltransferase family 4 protein n=2 Tax=unclassified Prevotella TaxID=2638335 RepID=A0AB33JKV8_9BACT